MFTILASGKDLWVNSLVRGSHGTCRTFARSIAENGFQSGSRGQLGKGIYFWVFADSEGGENLGRELSKAWFDHARRKNLYSSAVDQSCSIVFADLTISGDSVLDFDDVEVEADLNEFYNYVSGRFPTLGREEMSSICDEFIAALEEVRGLKYDAVLGMVDVPHDRLPDDHFLKFRRRSRCVSVQNSDVAVIRTIEDLQED